MNGFEIDAGLAAVIAALITAFATIIAAVLNRRQGRDEKDLPSKPAEEAVSEEEPSRTSRQSVSARLIVGSFLVLMLVLVILAYSRIRSLEQPQTAEVPIAETSIETAMDLQFDGRDTHRCFESEHSGYIDPGFFFIEPPENGWIAVCGLNEDWAIEGELETKAVVERDVAIYAFGLLFGWVGEDSDDNGTIDANKSYCLFGVEVEEGQPYVIYKEVLNGRTRPASQFRSPPLSDLLLTNDVARLRVEFLRDNALRGYLDDQLVAELSLGTCGSGAIGLFASGPGNSKILFDYFIYKRVPAPK